MGAEVQAQEVLAQSSYLSVNDRRLHFGLGGSTKADIDVRWPSGVVEKFTDVEVDRLIHQRRSGHRRSAGLEESEGLGLLLNAGARGFDRASICSPPETRPEARHRSGMGLGGA